MENTKNDLSKDVELTEELVAEEQLTVEVPIEVRAGGVYNCCKRQAL